MFVLGVILRNPSFTEEIIIKERCVPLVIMKETVVLHYSLHLYPVLHNCKCDLVISDKGSNTELCIKLFFSNRRNVGIVKRSNPITQN